MRILLLVPLLAGCLADTPQDHLRELSGRDPAPCGQYEAEEPRARCPLPAIDVAPIVACLDEHVAAGTLAIASGITDWYGDAAADSEFLYTTTIALVAVDREIRTFTHDPDGWHEHHCARVAVTDGACPRVLGDACE